MPVSEASELCSHIPKVAGSNPAPATKENGKTRPGIPRDSGPSSFSPAAWPNARSVPCQTSVKHGSSVLVRARLRIGQGKEIGQKPDTFVAWDSTRVCACSTSQCSARAAAASGPPREVPARILVRGHRTRRPRWLRDARYRHRSYCSGPWGGACGRARDSHSSPRVALMLTAAAGAALLRLARHRFRGSAHSSAPDSGRSVAPCRLAD